MQSVLRYYSKQYYTYMLDISFSKIKKKIQNKLNVMSDN